MLCLSRKVGEEILIDDGRIMLVVRSIRGNRVELGIVAPRQINIRRVPGPAPQSVLNLRKPA